MGKIKYSITSLLQYWTITQISLVFRVVWWTEIHYYFGCRGLKCKRYMHDLGLLLWTFTVKIIILQTLANRIFAPTFFSWKNVIFLTIHGHFILKFFENLSTISPRSIGRWDRIYVFQPFGEFCSFGSIPLRRFSKVSRRLF